MSQLVIVDNVCSTNSQLAEHAVALPHGYTLMARCQTAGRGQRGNTWESASGMNVTLSMLLRPTAMDVRQQFSLSEAVALGVVNTLDRYGINAKVKWPNDIYVGDHKICGILIENSLEGVCITRSIAGIGLNVNQREFVSNAPNPVSMWQLTGLEYDIEQIAHVMVDEITGLCDKMLDSASHRNELHGLYMRSMWRNDGGIYPYLDPASGQRFMAAICNVALTGHLTLRTNNGSTRTFAFKEVQAII